MHYQKPFLGQVVFQVNFNIIEALKRGLNSDIDSICQEITGQQKVEQEGFNIIIQAIGINQQPTSPHKIKVWNFLGESIRIQIHNTSLNITALKYSNHEYFHEAINNVFSKLNALYNPLVTRLSLRYVNNVSFNEGSTFDFTGLINPALLSPTLDFVGEDLNRSIGIISIKDSDDVNVNFTYGFLNNIQFPNKIAKREFVLDYDCALNMNDNIIEVKPHLLKLRNKANHLFEKSILDGLKQIMQPIN